jgi:DNA polymerase/3'-5' exonuclease PolX
MSDGRRFPWERAKAVAKELCDALRPACERMVSGEPYLIVAGSMRRRQPEVGDVEILFVPRVENLPDPQNLFPDAPLVPVQMTDAIVSGWVSRWVLKKRQNAAGGYTWGPQNKLAVHIVSGIPVDLFQLTRENWFNGVVCRTGSKESNARIALAAQKRGWQWNPYGAGFYDASDPSRLVKRVGSEREVFEAVGLPFLEPKER